MSDYGYCAGCGQYGCHLITCKYAFSKAIPTRQNDVQIVRDEITRLEAEVARWKEEAFRNHNAMMEVMTENERLKPPSTPVGGPHFDKEKMQVSCPHCHALLYNVKTAKPRPFYLDLDED